MNRGWTIAVIRGIPVRVHITLLLILPFLAFAVSMQFREAARLANVDPSLLILPPLVWGVILAIGLFVGVLLHELAHSLVAIATPGASVHSITLFMLGGVSRITGEIKSPAREAWMAAAGPLMSFAIAATSFLLAMALPAAPPDLPLAVGLFGFINAVVGVFNLLPAFPMDGGRILRAALTPWLGRLRATRIAAGVGKGMAVVFAIVALVPPIKPILFLIAVLVWIGATAEASSLETRLSLRGVPAGILADRRIGRVHPDTPLAEVAERFLRENLVALEVDGFDGAGGPSGWISVWDLERSARSKPELPARVLARRVPRVTAFTEATALLPRLGGERGAVVLVVDDRGDALGVVTSQDLLRATLLTNFLDGPARRGT